MKTKSVIVGALAMLGFLFVLAGGTFRFVPTGWPIGAIARIFDSLALWLLGGGLLLGLAILALRARFLGIVLCLAALAGSVELVRTHVQLSLPTLPEAEVNARVVFMNVLQDNAAWSHRIVERALAEEADALVFLEARALYPALGRLRETHAFVSPCEIDACDVLLATKRAPKRFWRLSLSTFRPDRYAVAELELAEGQSFFLVGNHLVKPWLQGLTEGEQGRLKAQYDWLTGPVVAVGDYNAAPWSGPMRSLLDFTGFRGMRWPMGTWPATAGAFGVPIDQVLVHNGARIVERRSFGDGMNSNHRGFVVDISLPK